MSRIDWVRTNCRLLAAIAGEFRATTPFAGLTIGTGIHLEPKTVALLLTLRDGGARVVATGNLNSTQPETVAYLRAHGVDVVGHGVWLRRLACGAHNTGTSDARSGQMIQTAATPEPARGRPRPRLRFDAQIETSRQLCLTPGPRES